MVLQHRHPYFYWLAWFTLSWHLYEQDIFQFVFLSDFCKVQKKHVSCCIVKMKAIDCRIVDSVLHPCQRFCLVPRWMYMQTTLLFMLYILVYSRFIFRGMETFKNIYSNTIKKIEGEESEIYLYILIYLFYYYKFNMVFISWFKT